MAKIKISHEGSARKKSRAKASISPDKYFMLEDGRAIKSIAELAMMIDDMSQDVFHSHVNEEKNDFANWIRDVFKDNSLAEDLMPVKDKKESQIALLKHAVLSK